MDIGRGKPVPILRLPRELRDEVWRYAVVRPKIFVSFGRLADLQQRGFCPDRPLRTCMSWENKDACRQEDLYESGTYFRPRDFEDFWNKDNSEDEFESAVDYDKLALGYPALDLRRDENKHPDLSIFLTCRQISAEAMDMYYAENNFVFCLINFGASDCNMTSANAALSFLSDRPSAMLPRIRHVDFHLYGWDEYDGFQVLDSQVWQSLLGLIKSSMRLQHLSLHFRGHLADLRGSDANAESSAISDRADSTVRHPRVTELAQLPKLSRLTVHSSGFRETKYQVDRHMHRSACFTEHSDGVCCYADSALQFAALVRVLRSNLLPSGYTLGSKNIRAHLMREDDPFGSDTSIACHDLDIHPAPKCDYFLSMQTDDDRFGNCLLPPQHPKPASDEDGTSQEQGGFIDIFEPLGDSASLDRVRTRGRRHG